MAIRLSFQPLKAEHLPACESLWRGTRAMAGLSMGDLTSGLGDLLRRRLALGALITGDDRPYAVGASAFIRREWLDAHVAAGTASLGWTALRDALTGGRAILSMDEIARENAGGGLTLLVLCQGHRARPDPPDEIPMVVGMFIESFFQVHRGFKIARFVNETNGLLDTEIVTTGRSFPVVRRFSIGEATATDGVVGHFDITREQAGAMLTPLMPLFVYSPPRLGLTPPEQELLQAALRGATNRELAEELGITESAVGSRWSRILARVADVPGWSAVPSGGDNSPRRGAQVRHHLLRYVASHPSELTPHAPLEERPSRR